MKVRFKCQLCGGKVLEEVMVGAMQSSVVTDFDAKTGALDYGEKSCEGGEVVVYRCGSCNEELRDERSSPISNNEDLVQWLNDHKPTRKPKGKKS